MNTATTRRPPDHRDTGVSRSRGVSSRIVMRAVLLLALVGSTVVLTQCQMVGDKLTGVQVGVFKRKNDCVRTCADRRKDATKAERKLHHDLVKACDRNPTCLKEEEDRHDAAEDAIEAAYRDCVNNCHVQGGDDD